MALSPDLNFSQSIATTFAACLMISQWITAWYLRWMVVLWVKMAMSASNSQDASGWKELATRAIPFLTWFLFTFLRARAAVWPATTLSTTILL